MYLKDLMKLNKDNFINYMSKDIAMDSAKFQNIKEIVSL